MCGTWLRLCSAFCPGCTVWTLCPTNMRMRSTRPQNSSSPCFFSQAWYVCCSFFLFFFCFLTRIVLLRDRMRRTARGVAALVIVSWRGGGGGTPVLSLILSHCIVGNVGTPLPTSVNTHTCKNITFLHLRNVGSKKKNEIFFQVCCFLADIADITYWVLYWQPPRSYIFSILSFVQCFYPC